MSNRNLFFLTVFIVLSIISILRYRKRALMAEQKSKNISKELEMSENERERVSGILRANRMGGYLQ